MQLRRVHPETEAERQREEASACQEPSQVRRQSPSRHQCSASRPKVSVVVAGAVNHEKLNFYVILRSSTKPLPKSVNKKKVPPARDVDLVDNWRTKSQKVSPEAKTPVPKEKSAKELGAVRETDGGLNDEDVKAAKTSQRSRRKQVRQRVSNTIPSRLTAV